VNAGFVACIEDLLCIFNTLPQSGRMNIDTLGYFYAGQNRSAFIRIEEMEPVITIREDRSNDEVHYQAFFIIGRLYHFGFFVQYFTLLSYAYI
jgi:hypothetical protein